MSTYNVWRVLRRVEDIRVVTEDGVYAEDQVPEDYGGFELKMKFLQRVVMTNNAGEILELRFDNVEDVMDKDGNTGLGLRLVYSMQDFVEEIPPTGPSEEFVEATGVAGMGLTGGQETRGSQVFNHMLEDSGD